MTREQLFAWSERELRFDDQVWVGREISIADVKAAVRQLFYVAMFLSMHADQDPEGGLTANGEDPPR